MARTPADIIARTRSEQQRVGGDSLNLISNSFDRILEGLSRMALAAGYGRITSMYNITLNDTTSTMIASWNTRDKLIRVTNGDLLSAVPMFITNQPSIAGLGGIILNAGESKDFIIVSNVTLYAFVAPGGGTAPLYVVEFDKLNL